MRIICRDGVDNLISHDKMVHEPMTPMLLFYVTLIDIPDEWLAINDDNGGKF